MEPKDLPDINSLDKQYVYLVAKSDDAHFQFHKEAKILLSYRDGMVFIQTDKPMYTPRQTGSYENLISLYFSVSKIFNNLSVFFHKIFGAVHPNA